MNFTSTSNATWLLDSDDDTCDTEGHENVTVTLDPAILLTWVRVVVTHKGKGLSVVLGIIATLRNVSLS